jgi:hypothetical protein
VDLGNRTSLTRCLAVWSCATSAATGAVRLSGPLAGPGVSALMRHRLDAVPLDRALAELAAVVLLGCAAWLWAGTSYVVLEAARGRARDRAQLGATGWLPSGLRRLVLAACGTAIVGTLAQPAAGAIAEVGQPGLRPHALVRSPLAGLPLPERATVGPPSRSVRHRSHREPTAASVVVAPGDTL